MMSGRSHHYQRPPPGEEGGYSAAAAARPQSPPREPRGSRMRQRYGGGYIPYVERRRGPAPMASVEDLSLASFEISPPDEAAGAPLTAEERIAAQEELLRSQRLHQRVREEAYGPSESSISRPGKFSFLLPHQFGRKKDEDGTSDVALVEEVRI